MSRAWASPAYDAKADDPAYQDNDGSMVQWARDLAEAQWLSMRPADELRRGGRP
jgi:hypothetical protein